MKEKEKRTAGSGGRLARGLLLTVLFMILSAGLVAVPASETQAASTTKKTVKIKLVGSSGDISLIQAITGGSGTRMAEVSAVSITSKYQQGTD